MALLPTYLLTIRYNIGKLSGGYEQRNFPTPEERQKEISRLINDYPLIRILKSEENNYGSEDYVFRQSDGSLIIAPISMWIGEYQCVYP
jgi:hypothetical protein